MSRLGVEATLERDAAVVRAQINAAQIRKAWATLEALGIPRGEDLGDAIRKLADRARGHG